MKRETGLRARTILYGLALMGIIACGGAGVTITSPTNGSTIPSPVHLVASATGKSQPITSMKVTVDGKPAGADAATGALDENLDLPAGAHTITVNAVEGAGTPYSAQVQVTVSGTATPPPTGKVPSFGHVYVVVEENHDYSAVMNGGMPYLVSLANKYAKGSNYFANTHPSIGNYLMMTAGQVFTNDDNYPSTINVDNIARQLIASGKTWRSYSEGIPSVGYVGASTGVYARKHNPLSYYSDVVNSAAQKQNLVSEAQWSQDLASGNFANYSFIDPNLNDDAHDGSLQQADDWLKANIDPLIQSNQFQNDGLLIIVFDEGSIFSSSHGGGQVPFVIVSSKVKKAYDAKGLYQHENLLKLTCQALGLQSCPGAASTANDMSEFF